MPRRDPLLLSILAALQGCSDEPAHHRTEGCLDVDATVTECPARREVSVDELFLNWECGYEIVEVLGPGTRKDVTEQSGTVRSACCYPVDSIDTLPEGDCVIGRPYHESAGPVTALVRPTGTDPVSSRAAAWMRAASFEHASVAAFARLSLQLMAHGAPTELLASVHRAAADEARHTELCLAEARRLGVVPSLAEFPFREAIDLNLTLATLAISAVEDGCIAETLGVVAAREALANTEDPAVRAALTEIVADESRHAELSFRIVAFALQRGGDAVRDAIVARLRAPWPLVDIDELALRTGVAPKRLAAATREGTVSVVQPALKALLADGWRRQGTTKTHRVGAYRDPSPHQA